MTMMMMHKCTFMQSATSINSMVLKFLEGKDAPEGINLGLHPLDIYQMSLLKTGTGTMGDEQGLRNPEGSYFERKAMH